MRTDNKFRVLLFPLIGALASCGGGGGGGGAGPPVERRQRLDGGGVPAVAPTSTPCASTRVRAPRIAAAPAPTRTTGCAPGPTNCTSGTAKSRIAIPSLYAPTDYFDLLKTNATTAVRAAEGQVPLHLRHRRLDGAVAGRHRSRLRRGVRGPCTRPAAPHRGGVHRAGIHRRGEQLARGDEILQVDGADAVNGNTQAIVDTLNAGLFPDATGAEPHFPGAQHRRRHAHRDHDLADHHARAGAHRHHVRHSVRPGGLHPVQRSHRDRRRRPRRRRSTRSATPNVTDLILDLRYNGGGYLDIASELAYMIGNTTLTSGRTFEKLVFNDKNPTRDPVTGELLTPTPFHSTSQGFSGACQGRALPTLNLEPRLHHHGTGHLFGERIHHQLACAASTWRCTSSARPPAASRMASTRRTIAGLPTSRIQFRGENAANFGDYSDGFSPANQTGRRRHHGAGLLGGRRLHARAGRSRRGAHRRGAGLPRQQQPDLSGAERLFRAAAVEGLLRTGWIRRPAGVETRRARQSHRPVLTRQRLF